MQETSRKFIRSIGRFFVLHRKYFQRQSVSFKLYPGQPAVLDCIRRNPGCTQADIAEELGVSSASIASSTKRLQKSGFLQKQVNSLNMRCNKLYITPEGEAVLNGFSDSFKNVYAGMFEGFSDEEIRQYAAFTERINQNLENKLAESAPAGIEEDKLEEY